MITLFLATANSGNTTLGTLAVVFIVAYILAHQQ